MAALENNSIGDESPSMQMNVSPNPNYCSNRVLSSNCRTADTSPMSVVIVTEMMHVRPCRPSPDRNPGAARLHGL